MSPAPRRSPLASHALGTRLTRLMALSLMLSAWPLGGCAGSPEIHYYRLAPPQAAPTNAASGQAQAPQVRVAIEYLSADAAYDDARIVYRKSPYRLDYYFYHRWSAPPSALVTDALRQSFQRSGRFAQVSSGYTARTDAILSGRLVALEEIDVSPTQWKARLVLDLQLHRTRDGELLWSRQLEGEEPVEQLDPEGVAKSLSQLVHMMSEQLIDELEPLIRQASSP